MSKPLFEYVMGLCQGLDVPMCQSVLLLLLGPYLLREVLQPLSTQPAGLLSPGFVLSEAGRALGEERKWRHLQVGLQKYFIERKKREKAGAARGREVV